MKISQGIKEVEKSARPIVNTLFIIGVGVLGVGALANVATSGQIEMPTALVTFLNGDFITNIVSIFTNATVVIATVVSLLIVAVLMLLFNFGGSKGGKSKGRSFA